MLRFLSIARLAIIDAVDLEFGPGLNVLTGETGAGKSIVVGALELLLGGRASADLVRSGEENAQVQAVLEAANGREVIVRRELTAAGRSRAFVDGTLVTSASLRETTAPLVDLHGQHDHQALLDPTTHLDLLDQWASLDDSRAEVGAAFESWRQARERLEASRLDDRERAARLDLLAFQLGEIERTAPTAGEDEALATRKAWLANADRLNRLCTEAYDDLYDGEVAVLERLARVWKRTAELATLDPAFAGADAARDVVASHLQDLALTLRERLVHLESSPEQLQAVEDRLAALERLRRRYGPTLDDVLERHRRLLAERDALSLTTERAAELVAAENALRYAFVERAARLGRERRRAAPGFATTLAGELGALAMPGARCEIRFDETEAGESRWSPRGIDTGELYLSANAGEAPRPLARIASGGELSRIMLALKTLASTDRPGKTLVFDEVDAGIGGRAADAVGARLRRLGERFQVLCITHLPQVAAHAHIHHRVEKHVRQGRTQTGVSRLAHAARVEELARMIGGDVQTAAVLDGARDLLTSRAGGPAVPSLQPTSSRTAIQDGEAKSKGESETSGAKAKGPRRK